MAKVQKGLGRGLDALFDDIEDVKEVTSVREKEIELGKVVELNIAMVEPMLNQPRKIFNKKKLEELANSIKEQGVIQPILVVKNEKGFTIISGERRWRAAKMAALKTVPAIVKDYTDTKKKQVALIDNIQREDLNIMEVAMALKELMEIEQYSISDVAKVTGKNASTISNIIRLLRLSQDVQQLVLDGELVEGQARALLVIDDKVEQLKIAKKIIEKKLTVREVEKLIYSGENKYNVKKRKVAKKSTLFSSVEEKLSEYFGYKVKIDANRKDPQIIIEYYNNEGLESILQKLKIEM